MTDISIKSMHTVQIGILKEYIDHLVDQCQSDDPKDDREDKIDRTVDHDTVPISHECIHNYILDHFIERIKQISHTNDRSQVRFSKLS